MGMKEDGIPRDKDIRRAFVRRNLEFFKQPTGVFVNEYGINRRNVCDLNFFDFKNSTLYGFEIKSAVDTLKRLTAQLNTYTDFFNIVYVICAENHLNQVEETIKGKNSFNHVGIIKVNNDLEFTEIKKAVYKKSFFDTFIKNLDKEELERLCLEKQLSHYGSKTMLIDRLKRHLNEQELFESLNNKLEKFYVKYCPSCSSRLYYNKYIMGVKNSYCYECDSLIY